MALLATRIRQAYQPVQMGEQIGAAQGGQRGVEGLEEVLVYAVHKAPQGQRLTHPGVSSQQQDPAAALDVIEPCRAFFQGLGIESILGLDVFISDTWPCYYIFVRLRIAGSNIKTQDAFDTSP